MNPSYREFVEAQVHRNPCLKDFATFLSRPYKSFDSKLVHCLDFPPHLDRRAVQSTTKLDACLSEISSVTKDPSGKCIRRVICIEDINPQSIEQLGAVMDISPLFFASYLSTSFKGIDQAPSPPSVALFPSQLTTNNSLHLHYQRAIKLPCSLASRSTYEFKSSGNIPRSIRRLAPLSGLQPGLIRSCCSILLKILDDQSWICIVLLDRTDADLIMPAPSGSHTEQYPQRTPQVPLQGAFEDFSEVQKYSGFCSATNDNDCNQRTSILENILHYYQTPPPNFDPSNPTVLAISYYLLRIVAAEWMLYTQLMSCYVKSYEYSFRIRKPRSMETDIIDLQRWRRRSKQSLHKLHLVELFLAKNLVHRSDRTGFENVSAYTTLREDFRYLSTLIEHHDRSFESILPVAATIVQLTDTRISIAEAVNVRYLTYVGLVFLPLTFASGIFSMQDRFLPGQGSFAVYISVAIPLVTIVVVVSLISSANCKKWRQKLSCHEDATETQKAGMAKFEL